jgi:hypothetical protein
MIKSISEKMEENNKIILSNGIELEKKVYSKYTVEELKEVIKCSKSYIEIIKTLKINKTYHTYLTKCVKDNNIDISHFTTKNTTRRKIDEILTTNSENVSSARIKKYLVKNNLVKEECSVCKIPAEWNNKPLTLQLDHINGDHFDNRVENLRLICPNCHSQTDTYTGRNTRTKIQNKCKKCDTILRTDNVTRLCAECIGKEKHLCSICKKNPRPGNWTKCTSCRKSETKEYKNCKKCNEPIKRNYNNTDYHGKCYQGEPFIKN